MAEINFKNLGRREIVTIILGILIIGAIWQILKQENQPKVAGEIVVRDEFLEKLIAESTQAYPLVVQGRKYYEQIELEKAQRLFKKATLLDRNWRDAFYHLGITELALGNLDPAMYALLRAKSIDPLYKPTYGALIKVYEQKGEIAKAEAIKQKLKALQ